MPDARRLTDLPPFDPCTGQPMTLTVLELAPPEPEPPHPLCAALDVAENAFKLGMDVWCRLLHEGAVALAELLHGRRPY